jgi:S1-C subfamily serine protease
MPTRGALITSVDKGGAAEAAGLVAGDIITEVDGTAVDDQTLPRVIQNHSAGKTVGVLIVRNGSEERKNIRLGTIK